MAAWSAVEKVASWAALRVVEMAAKRVDAKVGMRALKMVVL